MSMNKPTSKHGINFYNKNIGNTSHPINNNLTMQIHHLISKSVFRDLKASCKEILNDAGYDIDHIKNLVALPYHMEGACQLELQLHRSNHGNFDDEHDETYHEKVKEELDDAMKIIKKSIKKCDSSDSDSETKRKMKHNKELVIKEMNKKSKKMLDKISRFDIFLTAIASNFQAGGRGCRGLGATATKADIDNAKEENKCLQDNREGTLSDGHNHTVKEILNNKKYILKVGE